MPPMSCGITFCSLEHLSDGRLSTRLRGHGFVADSCVLLRNTSPRAASRRTIAPSVVWSQPDVAVLYRRMLQLSQPRRLRVMWISLDLRAGLALTEEQARAWEVDPGCVLSPATVGAIWKLVDMAGLDALVLPAGPSMAHKLVVGLAPDSPGMEIIQEWEVLGDSAEFDNDSLERYPAMLRQRHTSRERAALIPDAPRLGLREADVVSVRSGEPVRVGGGG